jgi:hypothetical protein
MPGSPMKTLGLVLFIVVGIGLLIAGVCAVMIMHG